MDVIGAGYGRTGTLSLKTALERLGFGPCHHMMEMGRPGQLQAWRAKTRGEPVPWETLFTGYRSAVDWPSAAYWRETTAHYRDAKVVLSVRDPRAWVASMRATILTQFARTQSPPGRVLASLSSVFGTRFAAFVEMTSAMPEVREFPTLSDDELVERFERHTAEVVETVPAERLLVYEVKQGWEPLCAFLDVPVPDEPFPRVNDSAEFSSDARRMILRMAVTR
ncbi:sulfotransferase family protein [Actinomadura logoneensis]|uniref:Sulfotransferase family protein n=1 Tax=Actinomadura logoneensis TaxID=2293572 RepID=A0A372J9B0_9ACTN|nr:sulfotransferase family protein [Actinomadura logoneensis]RFU36406.1 sulfotransferase family protein [Actinomadura logoneensis]